MFKTHREIHGAESETAVGKGRRIGRRHIFLASLLLVLFVAAISVAFYVRYLHRLEENATGDEIIYYRMDLTEKPSDIMQELANETVEKYYNTEFHPRDADATQVLYTVVDTAEDGSALRQQLADRISDARQFVEESGRFEDVKTSTSDTTCTISTTAANEREAYSLTFYTDGTTQAVYRIGWGSPYRSGISVQELAEQLSYFSGIDISAEDLTAIYNAVVEDAKDNGNYTAFVVDKWGYTYLTYTVKGYNSGTEYWECYISVTNKNS